MKKIIRIVLSLALSFLCLWLAFRRVELGVAAALVRRVDLLLVLAFIGTLVVQQLARAMRWKVLVQPFVALSSRQAFRMSNLGAMLVLVLPLRLGELSRPLLLKREHGAPASAGLGSVVVERVLDGLLVTLFFVAAIMFSVTGERVSPALHTAAFLALGLFVGALLLIVAALLWHERALSLLGRLLALISSSLAARVTGMLRAFIEGLRFLPSARALFFVFFWTVLFWAANGFGFYFVMLAFGWDLPLLAAFMLVSIVVIAIMVPAGPGFLGTYQAGLAAGLTLFAVEANAAAAYGLVVYPLNVLVVLLFGLPHLFAHRTPWRELVSQ